ncbi:hypothetical protein [Clostridium psychrophilum]|uniref:hypothetical protein n=1 Tax=Clostridium psychrophilum TaxID=132926 RepID=UPI001C0D7E19|nr:hypothetical protein [Clostridium psychrophilum]MBU3181694.1 hypothetical protein [Clostridium psychrophilum]
MSVKPVELIFHEVHDHKVSISDLWMHEVERRCNGQVHFTKYVGSKLPSDCNVDAFRDCGARIRSILPLNSVLSELAAEPVHIDYLTLKDKMASGELDAAVVGLLPAFSFNLVEEVAPYCMLA